MAKKKEVLNLIVVSLAIVVLFMKQLDNFLIDSPLTILRIICYILSGLSLLGMIVAWCIYIFHLKKKK